MFLLWPFRIVIGFVALVIGYVLLSIGLILTLIGSAFMKDNISDDDSPHWFAEMSLNISKLGSHTARFGLVVLGRASE